MILKQPPNGTNTLNSQVWFAVGITTINESVSDVYAKLDTVESANNPQLIVTYTI